jgi:hypothetical protein
MSAEEDHIRDVYAHYGAAAFFAQVLEKNLIGFLLLQARAADPELTRQGFDDLESRLHTKRTLGQLLKDVQAQVSYDGKSEELMNRALDHRNFLMHRYFWERAEDFMTPAGRETMLTELTALRGLFQEASVLALALCKTAAAAAGTPWSEIEAEFARRVRALRHPPEP